MRKKVLIGTALGLLLAGGLYAECQRSLTGSPPFDVKGPDKAERVRVTTVDGKQIGDLEFPAAGGDWKVDANAVTSIQSGVKTAVSLNVQRQNLRLTWMQGGSGKQSDTFLLPGEDEATVCPTVQQPPPPVASTSAPQGSATTETTDDTTRQSCLEKSNAWKQEIAARLPQGHYLVLVYGPNGDLIDENKDYGVSGDLIYTGICVDSSIVGPPKVELTKCDLQSPIPKNREDEGAFKAQAEGQVKLVQFPPRQCFGSAITVKVSGTQIVTVEGTNQRVPFSPTYTIGFYERYRYTLETAVINTTQHAHTFGLRPDGSSMRIFDKGPDSRGPEYTASIVLYALPRYFQVFSRSMRKSGGDDLEANASGTYYGRDVVNDHALADRLGLVIGVGLNDPGERFITGLSFELIPGVNLVGVYEIAKLNELAGVKVGDVFPGTADQIPVTTRWNSKVAVGLSLDARYVMGLFKRGT